MRRGVSRVTRLFKERFRFGDVHSFRKMSSKEMEEVALRGEPLDKSSFSMSFPSIALSVEKSRCSEVVRGFKKFLFHGRKVKPVRHDPAAPSTRRLVLLDPCVMKDSEEEKTELKIADRPPLIVPKRLSEKLEDLVGPQGKNISDYTVKVGFDGMSVDEILRKLLPKSEHHEIPSSFEQCGTFFCVCSFCHSLSFLYIHNRYVGSNQYSRRAHAVSIRDRSSNSGEKQACTYGCL